ncbi:cellulose binding domain-containing protein [Solwaraspora sp. WMMD1047]|uniref:glucuronyl esterase domain-containing protein n=1 Tax=Solwaraspora sp. WMMD1047 TaxID=3016102 RepID=UPI002417DD2E|nr:cellulose binding domain-containing protein [Solwaraspora sp. WMMD1047]MDG4832562.1 cellulose binding domain-containing protein [Solwaraspora sp. WMMD1047]
MTRTTTAAAAGNLAPAAAAELAVVSPVEDEGVDCPVPNPGSLPANSRLPDPFRKIDGTRITTKADWRCRRAETKELAERYVYGDKPAKPASVTGTVSNSSITVNVSHNGRSASFSASVSLPSGSGPFPAVVVLGGFGADTATIRSSGAAVINYDPLAVGREGTPRNNKQGAFYSIYGATSSTGLLAAWAWGVSRIIDVIEQSGGTILRPDATGVTGCSRYGKGAFVIGALDQRIALTMPIESGSAGAPIFRGIPGESGAQPLSSAYGEQPWLGDAFSSFTGNPSTLPVDTHQTVAMIAPRGLFIMENPHIDWLASRSGSVAALGGAEVYRALGAGENITYWSDVQDGSHCASRPEWRTPLQQHIQKFLLKTGNAAGTFRISSRKAGNLAEWRDWQTPTLADGPTTPPPTTPPPTTPPPTTPPPTTPPPTTPPPTTPPPTTPPPTTPPPAGGGCSATVSLNQWNGGFVATVRVTAGSAPVAGWTVTMTLPSGASVTNAWNASRSGSTGTVQFTNVSYNGAIGAGQSTEFGFQGTGSGSGMTPTCSAR